MNRLALMIGINEYPNLAPSFQLQGCVNDLELFHRLLVTRFGFAPDNIETLINGQATRENILDSLDRLAGMGEYEGRMAVQEGDLLCIFYAGHGSRLKEPPDQRDEPDGYDSTIVPCDSDRPRPVGRGGPRLDITDDELYARLLRIKQQAAHVILYFDCCHSGTLSRDLEGGVGRSLPPAEEGYSDVLRLNPYLEAGGRSTEGPVEKGRSGWLPPDEGYILIAGCRDEEVAREYHDTSTGSKYGALSYFFTRELERASERSTYRDIFQRVQAAVTTHFPSQHPQMEGDWDRLLFEHERLSVAPFVEVQERLDDRRLRLAVGAAQMASPGARWSIRPAELAEEQLLATVTLRTVGALSSMAESDEPLPPEVEAGCRAVEIEHPLGQARIRVAVEGDVPAELEALRDGIRASLQLELADRGSVDFLGVRLPPRSNVDPQLDFAPELGPLSAPLWVLVGRDRHLLPAPPREAGAPEAVAATLANMESWARALYIRRLQPAGVDPLRGKLRARLLRFVPGEDPAELPLDEALGVPVLHAGERVVIELENRHDAELYYTIFDLGLSGRVARLLPPPNSKKPLAPGASPLREGEQYGGIPLVLPENFPAQLDGGWGGFKIMVTPVYASFDTFTQEGMRAVDRHPAELLLAPPGSRDVDLSALPVATEVTREAWTVEQLDYYLAR